MNTYKKFGHGAKKRGKDSAETDAGDTRREGNCAVAYKEAHSIHPSRF